MNQKIDQLSGWILRIQKWDGTSSEPSYWLKIYEALENMK